nr:major tail protein [uncultured Ruminococcus sp.]
MATIGLQNPYFSIITEDPITGYESYSTPERMAKAISADFSIELLEAILFADNGAAESMKQFKQGSITLGVDKLLAGVQQKLLGAKVDKNGVVTYTAEGQAPYVAVGFASLRSDGTSEYVWLLRVRFGVPNRTYQTLGDSATFQTPSLVGTVMRANKPDSDGEHPFMRVLMEGEPGAMQTAVDGWFDSVYETDYSGESVSLSDLTIGSISLSPAFDADVTEYTAATSNATNTITATLNDNTADAVITVNGDSLTNGGSASWETGENTVNIAVTKGTSSKKYTVIVTKS